MKIHNKPKKFYSCVQWIELDELLFLRQHVEFVFLSSSLNSGNKIRRDTNNVEEKNKRHKLSHTKQHNFFLVYVYETNKPKEK